MSTKHTVTFPDGTTATRTSANRSYPFAVAISPMPRAERIQRLQDSARTSASYIADYQEVIDYLQAGGEIERTEGFLPTVYATNLKPGRSRSGNEQSRGQRSIGFRDDTREEIVAKYEGYRTSCEEAVAKAEREIAEAEAGPDLVGGWHLSGWQSRDDLARKERDRMAGVYPGRQVLILDSERITK